jgi:hypothetical protein
MYLRRPRKTKCDKIMLFTNARDESNINEWIAHHFLLGFDNIFIFDHLSQIPIKEGSHFNGKLMVHRVNLTTNNIKLNFMKIASKIASRANADWMLYLDADEYLCINNCTNIKSYLKHFSEADAIGINWLMFGSSNHVEHPDGLLTENFTMSEPVLNQHVKSFVRPERVINITIPHFYIIPDVNRYYNGFGINMPMNPFNQMPVPFSKSPIYVAHYYVQSENMYRKRKGRIMDDGSTISMIQSEELHKLYNTVNNNQLKVKYSENIKRFLSETNLRV